MRWRRRADQSHDTGRDNDPTQSAQEAVLPSQASTDLTEPAVSDRNSSAESALDTVPPLRLDKCEPYDVRTGGLAHVYLCRRPQLDPDHVAVKRLRDELAGDLVAADLFVDECRVWLRLGAHPNVVTAVSSHWVPPEAPLIVLEYVEMNLREVMARGPVTVPESLRIAASICDGMTHLATSLGSFVHRDLKPENVLMSLDGTVKVTDFGLARVQAYVDERAETGEVSTTGAVGTPAYMSPEQFLRLPATPASDVYAFGCILAELVSGTHPFAWCRNAANLMTAHLHGDPSLPRPDDCPETLIDLARDCLAKNPTRRPQTFEHVRRRLALIAESLGAPLARTAPVELAQDRQLLHAQGLLNIGATQEAVDAAQIVLETTTHPSGILWARTLIARILIDDGRLDEATYQLDEAAAHLSGPGPVLVGAYWNERGRLTDDPVEAEKAYRRGLELVPDASVGWWNLCMALHAQGRLREAVEAARQAINCSADLRYFQGLCDLLLADGDSATDDAGQIHQTSVARSADEANDETEHPAAPMDRQERLAIAEKVATLGVLLHPHSRSAWFSLGEVVVCRHDLDVEPAALAATLFKMAQDLADADDIRDAIDALLKSLDNS